MIDDKLLFRFLKEAKNTARRSYDEGNEKLSGLYFFLSDMIIHLKEGQFDIKEDSKDAG